MKIGSLFSGIGGLELGLEWAGVGHTVWQVEQDAFCKTVLARHWPDAARFDDVRAVGAHNLPAVDLICGGFPCQDVSTAGKGAGLDGERSGLWFEYARIVCELRPRFVVIENVGALVARGLDRVLGSLAASGYDAVWFPLRASNVGAPHRRERIFIVGWHRCGDGVADAGCERDETRRNARNVACETGDAEGVGEERQRRGDAAGNGGADVANAEGERIDVRGGERTHVPIAAGSGQGMADGERDRLQGLNANRAEAGEVVGGDAAVADASIARREGTDGHERSGPSLVAERPSAARCYGRRSEPLMGGVPDGLPRWLDRWPSRPGEAQHEWEAPRVAQGVENRAARLRALGNAVVPAVAYVVGRVVMQIAEEMTP